MGTQEDDGYYDQGGTDEFKWKGDNEKPHNVTLTYSFDIFRTEITLDIFKQVMGYNPSKFYCKNAVCPVENVSYYDALAFANKYSRLAGLNECFIMSEIICMDGNSDVSNYCSAQGGIKSAKVSLNNVTKLQECKGYRLPTEAEWEYASSGGYELPKFPDRPFFLGGISVFGCDPDPILTQMGWYCGNSTTKMGR